MANLYRVLVTYDGRCFGCGQDNDEGLKMRFEPTVNGSVCEFEVPDRYQSWRGMIHGGMIALMLDEAVGWAGWHAGHPGLTGRLEVRFRQPLRLGDRVRVVGRVEKVRRTLVYASAFIERTGDHERIAEATATLLATPTELTAPRS
jgi:acyl-coenzyme A thioesterase PaaI-like protein